MIGEEGLKDLVTNYFSALFSSVAGEDSSEILNQITPKVSTE